MGKGALSGSPLFQDSSFSAAPTLLNNAPYFPCDRSKRFYDGASQSANTKIKIRFAGLRRNFRGNRASFKNDNAIVKADSESALGHEIGLNASTEVPSV